MFWWWIFNDFIDDVVDLIKNFSCSLWYVALKFTRTDLINLITFDWTFTNASVWRTALTFTVISSWMILFSFILISFIPIEVNFLHLDWIDLPSSFSAFTLDNCCIKGFFNSNWGLCSSKKWFSERTDYFRHQMFFFSFDASLMRVIMWLNSRDLMHNGGYLAQACLPLMAFSWLLESLVKRLLLFTWIESSILVIQIFTVSENSWSLFFDNSVIFIGYVHFLYCFFDSAVNVVSDIHGDDGLVVYVCLMLKWNTNFIHLIQTTIVTLLLSLRTYLRCKVFIVEATIL